MFGHLPNFVRKAEQVHNDEIGLAITTLLRDAGSTERSELLTAVARIFGWARAGADITRRLAEVIEDLVANGKIEDSDGRLSFSSEKS